MRFFKTLLEAIRWLFRVDHQAPSINTVVVEDLPDHLLPNTIYLVGEDKQYWQAAMRCPCRCGELIQLNLAPPGPPCWRVRLYWDMTVTLSPSVWRSVGCFSHFWIRRSRVLWVGRGEAPQRS